MQLNVGAPYVAQFEWNATGAQSANDFGTSLAQPSNSVKTTNTVLNIANYYLYIGESGISHTHEFNVSWFLARIPPPLGIMPSASFGSLTSSAPVGTTLVPSNTLLDCGQYEVYTTYQNGGTAAFTYNDFNVTGAKTLNKYTSVSAPSNTYTYQSSCASTGTFQYNAIVTDSMARVTNSITNTIVVNPTFKDIGFAVLDNPIDTGVTQKITSTLSGGTSPYSYNYLIYNAVGTLVANYLVPSNSYTSNVFSYVQNPLWGTGTFSVVFNGIDSATTPVTVTNSLTYTVYLSPIPTLTPSNAVLDCGQYEVYTGVTGGGVTPFTYNYFNITGSSNLAYYSNGLTSNTYTYQSSCSSTGSFTYNLIITDLIGTTANSISNTIMVNSALTAGTPTASNTVIDIPQYSLITSHASGGSPSYSYQWYTNGGCTAPISGATSSTYLAQPSSTITYYYIVTDQASTPVSTSCSSGVTITVHATPYINITISPANSIFYGTSTTMNAVITGGYWHFYLFKYLK